MEKNSLEKANKTLDFEYFDYNDYGSISLLSNGNLLSKNGNINRFNNVSDLDVNSSNITKKTLIEIKNNSQKLKVNLKENDLPLYKGEINYNMVFQRKILKIV